MRPALSSFLLLTLITGLAYPLLVTGVAKCFYPNQANGSLLSANGAPAGSALIGQPFDDPKYFWSRPSATAPMPYNAAASGASNLAPAHPQLLDAIAKRVAALRAADPGNTSPVPVDLVTASASGLDPHISINAARYQVTRIARARNLKPDELEKLINAHTEPRTLGVLGEPRVNVLQLNLTLDGRIATPPGGR